MKQNAKTINLTLSEPAREWLAAESERRGVSRTQVVEDLIREKREAENGQ